MMGRTWEDTGIQRVVYNYDKRRKYHPSLLFSLAYCFISCDSHAESGEDIRPLEHPSSDYIVILLFER